MMKKDVKSDFISHLIEKYPGLSKSELEPLISENLLSPCQVEIPQTALEKIKVIISAFYEMRSLPKYEELLASEIKSHDLKDPGNKGILMSYDFHLDESQNPKLIEINTNASFLALGFEYYQSLNCPLPLPHFSLLNLKENILEELSLFQTRNSRPKFTSPVPTVPPSPTASFRIAIVDDSPSEQKLYSEFLLYRELFKSWGWDAQIINVRDLEAHKDQLDFIYNRHTDFYLKEDISHTLNSLYLNHKVCISPHPYEYFMLADKERYSNWSDPDFLKALGLTDKHRQIIESALLPSFALNSETAERAWTERKKLFFKPLNSFGSKQAYKGASISRGIFEAAVSSGSFLAQTYVPAPEQNFTLPDGTTQSMKYDLRCYAYQGTFQFAIARLYQGQVTNLRVAGGGFAPLISFK